jgi:hypothetical protein
MTHSLDIVLSCDVVTHTSYCEPVLLMLSSNMVLKFEDIKVIRGFEPGII